MILLDTCAFIWLSLEQSKLSAYAKELIDHHQMYLSDISLLEVGYLIQKGQVELPCRISEFLSLAVDVHQIQVLPVTPEIADIAMGLDHSINKDPADRIISATSIHYNYQLTISDGNLRKSELVKTAW